MKHKNLLYIIIFFILSFSMGYGKVANCNHFASQEPSHILDAKLTDISFAFSMRVLESDYNGPLIRLRRTSDNAEQDFGWGDNDIVDVAAIDAWRGTSNVHVHTWYDQSGLGRNAVQVNTNAQPQFFTNVSKPYFQGDGNNDHLTVITPNGIQDVTNNGNEGTLLTVMRATQKMQHTFGVLTGNNRWSAHVNWSNGNLYFDPGICCKNPRSFNNNSERDSWTQYTFLKTSTRVIVRVDSIEKLNGMHTTGRCTRTENFAIGWATGKSRGRHSNASFVEFVMYSTNIATTEYQEIENNAITFWEL